MNLLEVFYSDSRKHPDDSWQIGRLLASLFIILVSIFAVLWQYGSQLISLCYSLVPKTESVQSVSKINLNISDDYFWVPSIIAAVFSVGIIISVFIVIKFMTSLHRATGRLTSQSSGSGDETEKTNIDTLNDSQDADDDDDDDDDDDLWCPDEDFFDMTRDAYTEFYDVVNNGDDASKLRLPFYEETNETGDVVKTVRTCGYPVTGLFTSAHSPEDGHKVADKNRPTSQEPVCNSSPGLEPTRLRHHHHRTKSPSDNKIHLATQTDELPRPTVASSGTMTAKPQLVDASVGSLNKFKIVRSCETSTSGPFMKKLRRAQRLLNEARVKFKTERQGKLVEWKVILSRYKDRVKTLLGALEKKDILMSYTALNRALSENEVKDMCTTVSSARDRLLTQCKLNFALKEVVESKCESGTPDIQGQAVGAQS